MTVGSQISSNDTLSNVSNDHIINTSNSSTITNTPCDIVMNFLTRNSLNLTVFCWLCRDTTLVSSEREFNDQWVSACNCEGVREFAHQKCLLTYIINNKYYNPQWEIKCSWCNAPYLITVDGPSLLYRVQTFFDKMLSHFVPGLVSTGAILSVGALAYCYGDTLLRFVHGREEFLELFGGIFCNGSNVVAEFHMMLLPISLIYFESYNWEHPFASKIIRRVLIDRSIQSQNLLVMNEIFNQDTTSLDTTNNQHHSTSADEHSTNQRNEPIMLEVSNNDHAASPLQVDISNLDVYPREKRNVVGFVVTGLALPFLSYCFSSVLFPRVSHNLLRTYLGWACIQGIRGAFRIAYQVHAVKVVTSIKIFNRNKPVWSHFNSQ